MKIHVTCSKDYDIYLEKGFWNSFMIISTVSGKYLSYLMTMYRNVISRRYQNNFPIPIFTL